MSICRAKPLFKRGWRADKGEAPLKENLAAGLLALAGWAPSTPLADLFCGSGTIVIEAASIAAKRAPGLNRRFAFERLKGFDSHAWRRLKDAARAAVDDTSIATLAGSDISTRVIEQAIANAQLAGLQAWLDDGRLRFNAVDARAATPTGSQRNNRLESALRRAKRTAIGVGTGHDEPRRRSAEAALHRVGRVVPDFGPAAAEAPAAAGDTQDSVV